jgi:hypothetical protein
MRYIFISLIVFLVVAISGCGKPEKKEYKPIKAVEDMTGMTTLKNGEKMKKKLKEFEALQKEREKQLDEVK